MSAQAVALPDEPAAANASAPRRGAGWAVALLLAINLFNYIDRQVLAAVEPQIRASLLPGDPNAMAKTGLLSTAFIVTYMLLAPLFGRLGDRTSRWAIIGGGVIFWSLASGASGLAGSFLVLFLTRCLVGTGEAAYGPVAPTVISDLYPVKNRGKVLACFYLAIPVGSALGYTLGGTVTNVLRLDWWWAFYLVVPPGIVLGSLAFLMREPRRGQADGVAVEIGRAVPWRDCLGVLVRTPSYVFDTLGMTAMTFSSFGLGFFMPAYLKERGVENLGGLDPVTCFGAMTALAGLVATLLGGLLGDWLRGRFPGSYFLVSGVGMLLGFPMALLVLWTPFPLAWVFVFLTVFCLFFNTGPTNTILANVTPPSMRATAYAVNIFIIHILGDAFSPFLIGFISDLWSLTAGFVVVSFTILLGGLFWLWGAQYLEEDTRLAPTRLNTP